VVTRSKFIPVITGELWFELSRYPRVFREVIYLLLRAVFQKSYVVLAISKRVRSEIIAGYKIDPKKVVTYKYKVSSIFNPSTSKELKETLGLFRKKLFSQMPESALRKVSNISLRPSKR
jgi:hypothetical protein